MVKPHRPGHGLLGRGARGRGCARAGRREDTPEFAEGRLGRGFQGCGLSIIRIRYLAPRMSFCVGFSCLAVLRIEGCLNSTL